MKTTISLNWKKIICGVVAILSLAFVLCFVANTNAFAEGAKKPIQPPRIDTETERTKKPIQSPRIDIKFEPTDCYFYWNKETDKLDFNGSIDDTFMIEKVEAGAMWCANDHVLKGDNYGCFVWNKGYFDSNKNEYVQIPLDGRAALNFMLVNNGIHRMHCTVKVSIYDKIIDNHTITTKEIHHSTYFFDYPIEYDFTGCVDNFKDFMKNGGAIKIDEINAWS